MKPSRAGNGGCGGRFVEPAPGELFLPHRIDDATVQYVLRAVDWAVFSFRRVMVSSSVLLAETFGLPVIVPDLPTLRAMVEPGRNGFVYPAGDAEALARLMAGRRPCRGKAETPWRPARRRTSGGAIGASTPGRWSGPSTAGRAAA